MWPACRIASSALQRSQEERSLACRRTISSRLPLKTYGNNFGGFTRNRLLYFLATSKTDDTFNDAVDEARFLLRTRRRLKADEKDNFGIVTPDAITGFRDRLLGPTYLVAIAVPAIALLVGAIVIMNIMLVSVTERTKEIGVRKSLGARQMDILKQFLVEAVTLSAIGGGVGVLLAWIIGMIMTAIFFPTNLSIGAILFTVFVSGGNWRSRRRVSRVESRAA